jgi:hypothetical protein
MRWKFAATLILSACVGGTSAIAASWQKWDDVTWIDMSSIHTANGITTYNYLMLDHIVSFPTETQGNSSGRINCATGEIWDWAKSDPDGLDDTPAHWEKSSDNGRNSASNSLFHKICGP